MALGLQSPVTELKGIKTVRQKQLEKLGIRILHDLLSFFPRTYEDRTKLVRICDLIPNEPSCFEAMVISTPRTSRIRKGLQITKLQVADETGKLALTYFNQPYVADNLHYGESYRFYGKLSADGSLQMQNPTFESESAAGTTTGRLFPIYSLTEGLSNNTMIKSIEQAIDACLDDLPEFLPLPIRQQYNLCSVQEAYRSIHNPRDYFALERARTRLVFEEFFLLSAGLGLLRAGRTDQTVPPMNCGCVDSFIHSLPYALTNAQRRTIDEICADLASGIPMNRLVQGDVGCGKTVVAAAAAFCAIQNGKQAAFMVPTEILAEQHYASLSKMLEPFGIRTVLLSGALTAAQKRAVKEQIADGTAQLVIGTHALFTNDVAFSDLALVIADEQHRFGVAQRAALAAKASQPHLLVMSATPIPRTLALIAYGELDISVIGELPPGRQKIDTFLVGEDMRKRINAFIAKQCAMGGQAYIVCPAVEESEMESLKSVEVWAQTLQMAVFPDLRVGLLHGKMKAVEKDAVMAQFSAHELDILVATTVIEVGVDVPNATLMVIENADRFGLSQLHQLRGRVGRGEMKSYCVMFSSNQNPDTRERLQTMCQTNDGFVIAQKDLQQRGPGDFFGSRQHGLPLIRAAGLEMDMQTLELARQAASEYLADGWQKKKEFAPLLSRVQMLFSNGEICLN